jgi:MFS family permease
VALSIHLLLASASVHLSPGTSSLPGSAALQNLANGIAGWALMAALVGLVIGAGLWALGAHAQNYQQSFTGRRTVLASLAAALVIGAAPALINFFFATGTAVK